MHMAAVRILGIDPGTVVVGYACLEVRDRARASTPPNGALGVERPLAQRASNLLPKANRGDGPARLVDAGALRLGRNPPVGARLARLVVELEALIARHAPDEIALEEAFCGRSMQAALRIGEARGVVLATAYRAGLVVHEFTPARIKRSVAGHGGASKESVARMASRALGLGAIDGPPDVGDAVAVALCRVEHRRSALVIDGR